MGRVHGGHGGAGVRTASADRAGLSRCCYRWLAAPLGLPVRATCTTCAAQPYTARRFTSRAALAKLARAVKQNIVSEGRSRLNFVPALGPTSYQLPELAAPWYYWPGCPAMLANARQCPPCPLCLRCLAHPRGLPKEHRGGAAPPAAGPSTSTSARASARSAACQAGSVTSSRSASVRALQSLLDELSRRAISPPRVSVFGGLVCLHTLSSRSDSERENSMHVSARVCRCVPLCESGIVPPLGAPLQQCKNITHYRFLRWTVDPPARSRRSQVARQMSRARSSRGKSTPSTRDASPRGSTFDVEKPCASRWRRRLPGQYAREAC